MTKSKLCILHNVKTNWSNFQELLTTTLDNSILLKIDNNIVCTIDSFNHAVQQDVSNATGSSLDINTEYSSAIEDKLAENRKLQTRRYKNICNQLLSKLLKRLKRRQTQYPPVRKQDESWVSLGHDEEKAETFANKLFADAVTVATLSKLPS
ncbi:hypothetical protein HN011_003952 [Eciton burchellii]|nr:hypothetical protein HN011_003952 [Eciton burchellii]